MARSKSPKGKCVNDRELVVGIDVAKHQHVARILFPDGSESQPFGFSNYRRGFETFLAWLFSQLEKAHCDSLLVGLESTGHYWEPLAFFLEAIPRIQVVQVSPKHVKKTKEVYDNSPGKTDRKDAGVIAMLIQMGRFQRLVLPRGPYAELRGYARLRERKMVELGVQRNLLHSLVDWVFPEYGSLFPKLEGKTSLTILKHYTTPEQILRAGPKSLSAAIRQASHGRLSATFSQRLIEAASATIGLQEGIEAAAFAIRNIVASVERIQEEIATIEKELARVLDQIPYASQLFSIPGVGKISVAIILGEAGDLRRYHKAQELIKLAGLNLFEISSGMHQGRRHISKRGRPLLRKCLFFAALRTVKTGGAFREIYGRWTQRNQMQKTKALVGISRKLLSLLFALARDNAAYHSPRVEPRAA
jgi:transposase